MCVKESIRLIRTPKRYTEYFENKDSGNLPKVMYFPIIQQDTEFLTAWLEIVNSSGRVGVGGLCKKNEKSPNGC